MRLYSFRIQDFKSIKDTGEVKVSPDDNITILAGQNESGKSSILEALDFFEKGAGTDFEDMYRRLNTHPRVECTYYLTTDELNDLERLSGSKGLRQYIQDNGITLVRGKTSEDDFTKIKYLNPNELDILVKALNEPESTEDTEEGEEATPFSFYEHVLSLKPTFIFYSSFEENILPSKITKAKLGDNQAVDDFEKVFGVDFDALLDEKNDAARKQKLNEINDKASDNLNEYWSQKIDDEKSSYKFAIDAIPQIATPTDSYIRFFIDQGDNFPLHFGQKSKGFQWFSSFNLRLRAHEADSDNLSDFILLIDEPGQGLHEEAQKDVKRVLNELAQNGVQMLFSTHQAQLLKSETGVDFARLKLVARSKTEGTKLKNIAQSSTDNGFKDALSPVRTAMGLITLDISSFIDNKKTVIVEGITDFYYIQAFCNLYGTKSSPIEISVIPCVGVSQAPNVYSILFGWGIGAKLIVDDDSAGTKAYNAVSKNFLSDAPQDTLDATLYKNKDKKGIEDTFSKSDFATFASDFVDTSDEAKSNGDIAKGKKELIARTFLDKVSSGEIKKANLDDESKKSIAAIVEFLKK